MATRTFTIADVHPQFPILHLGGLKAVLVTLTFDDGADGVESPLTAARLGLSEILFVIPQTDAGDNGTVVGEGWIPQFNYVTGAIQMLGSGAATTDELDPADEALTDVQVRCLVLGV